VAASAHVPLPTRSKRMAEFDACMLSAEGACAETPLTSEPPLADAEPLTSEPPLADAAR